MIDEKKIIDLAQKYFINTNTDILKGIGDDCAVTKPSQFSQLFTSDMLVENTHFLFDKIPAYLLGWKSLAVNISDIASMGGIPKYALLSLGINNKIDLNWLEQFYQGISDCAKTYQTSIIGGDTVKSAETIVINIALTGETQRPIYRDNIKNNYLILSTGYLGLSGAGFWCITNNIENSFCIEKHNKPIPKVQEGIFLNNHIKNIAMLDSSDGLYKSIETMCEKSNLGAEIYFDNLDIHDQLQNVCTIAKKEPEDFILYGGEDYELIFAIDENDYKSIKEEYFKKFDFDLKILGRFTDTNKEISLIKGKSNLKIQDRSFKHL